MTTFTQTIVESFTVVSCYTCGVRFGISNELYRRVVTKAEGSVYCPACGKLTCWTESADAKEIRTLRSQLEREQRNAALQKDLRETAEMSLRSTKGAVTKLKKRIGAGVCPCCQRTFKQLSRHMTQKHPEFPGVEVTP